MPYDAYFVRFCKTIFQYQYVTETSVLTPAILEWLYEHSAGVISVVVSLIHDAQEIAILNGTEFLDLKTLNEAYKQRLSFLHGYIQPNVTQKKQCASVKTKSAIPTPVSEDMLPNNLPSIQELVRRSKAESREIVAVLKEHYPVTEVAV